MFPTPPRTSARMVEPPLFGRADGHRLSRLNRHRRRTTAHRPTVPAHRDRHGDRNRRRPPAPPAPPARRRSSANPQLLPNSRRTAISNPYYNTPDHSFSGDEFELTPERIREDYPIQRSERQVNMSRRANSENASRSMARILYTIGENSRSDLREEYVPPPGNNDSDGDETDSSEEIPLLALPGATPISAPDVDAIIDSTLREYSRSMLPPLMASLGPARPPPRQSAMSLCLSATTGLPPKAAALFDKRTSALREIQSQLRVAQQRQVAHQAAKQATNESYAQECPICLQAMSTHDACLTRCGHMFCFPCILNHLEHSSQKKCPNCRADVCEPELIAVKSGLPEKVVIEAIKKQDESPEVVIVVDKKGDDVIDLVDKPDMPTTEEELVRATAAATAAVDAALRDNAEVIHASKAASDEVVRVRLAWEEEKKSLDEDHRKAVGEIRIESEKVKSSRKKWDIKTTELNEKVKQYDEKLSSVNLKESNLCIQKKRLEAHEEELNMKGVQLQNEREGLLLSKRKYEDLVKSRENGDDMRRMRRENDKLKEELKAVKQRLDDTARGSPAHSSTMSVAGPASRNGLAANDDLSMLRPVSVTPAQDPITNLFGVSLQEPSRINRPQKPRGVGRSLSAFAPKRPKVQKPKGSIGKR